MESSTKKKGSVVFLIATIVIVLDQWSKYAVRTTPDLQNWVLIDGWLRFFYTQNPGMALGIDILPTLVIGVISVIATLLIGYLMITFIPKANKGQLIIMGAVMGGAIGNIYDRMFMGLIEGYSGFLQGHVVDFIHFYLEIGDFPVFPYIFNIADIAISCSIIISIIFYKHLVPKEMR